MAIKKQLKDKDGNTIYPDVGLNLDDVVYSDDPESVGDDYIDPASYSTTEHKTGGTWIDGKPIYKKTISCGSLANATKKTVAHSISNFGSLIKSELRWYDTGDSRWFYNFRYDTSTVFVNFDGCNATNLYINCQGTNWSTRTNNCYATLYYTKTTD